MPCGASTNGTGSSPHTRGAPTRRLALPPNHRIIPAYAGSTGSTCSAGRSPADHPRIRGEHSLRRHGRLSSRGSSPHTRGAPGGVGGRRRRWRIIPAYARITHDSKTSHRAFWDHPRIRGEHVIVEFAACFHSGSSPHTRGAPPGKRSPAPTRRDHPRIRGEHEEAMTLEDVMEGSSPHTRGAHAIFPVARSRPGIIPAYAGSTAPGAAASAGRRDHPRIRGEHSIVYATEQSVEGSSPHTRGARQPSTTCHSRRRIIPAYAGSTMPA